jgi:hypothetical protein
LLCVRLAALAVLARLASQSFIQIHETLLIRPSRITEIVAEGAKRAGRQSYQWRACIVRDGRRKRRLVEPARRTLAIDELVVPAAAIFHLNPAVHDMKVSAKRCSFSRPSFSGVAVLDRLRLKRSFRPLSVWGCCTCFDGAAKHGDIWKYRKPANGSRSLALTAYTSHIAVYGRQHALSSSLEFCTF